MAEHVELAYARTVIGAQGRNVEAGAGFFDKPTDVRNLYVAMTRGTGMNEAFMVTTGEQTAADVFTQSIATDWIDLPAHARRAELREESPHRPGLLDGGQLRELLESRFAITSTIEDAEHTLDRLPGEWQQAERAHAAAENAIAERGAAYRRAEDILERYDRPLHRRKHETEIATARRDIERIPRTVQQALNDSDAATDLLDRLRQNAAQANENLRRRPEFEAKIAAIDERVDRDLRVRTRIMRVERPDAIVNVLGDRPAPGPAARQWDAAAGQLAQHQAAFNITDDLGPQPGYFDHSAYTESHALVDDLITPMRRTIQPRHA